MDLGYIRAHPHHVNRNFEGFNHRDLVSATMISTYSGEAVDFTSITGGSWWRNEGLTDLDYGPFAPFTHQNTEQQNQFTQEFRIANAKDKPIGLGNNLDLNWQTGVSVFTQDYRQSVSNFFGITQLTQPLFVQILNNGSDWGPWMTSV